MAVHARLKNESTEDEKYHNLMTPQMQILFTRVKWYFMFNKWGILHESSCIIEFDELWEKIRCDALPSILSILLYEFNKFNNIGARMWDSSYYLIRDFRIKTSTFRH